MFTYLKRINTLDVFYCSLVYRAHNAAVTCTMFAPVPELIFEAVERGREAAGKPRETPDSVLDDRTAPLTGYVVISGDYNGDIKVFIKEGKVSIFFENDFLSFAQFFNS